MSTRLWIHTDTTQHAIYMLHMGMIGALDSFHVTRGRISPMDQSERRTIEIELRGRDGTLAVPESQLREIGQHLLHVGFVDNFGFFNSDEPLPDPETELAAWTQELLQPTAAELQRPADY